MLKIIGAVLVLAATTSLGLSGVYRLKARVRALESITAALTVMQSEICSKLTPMGDLIEWLAKEAPYPSSLFFQNMYEQMGSLEENTFYTIWSESVRNTSELMLTREEADTLCELGMCLGKYNIDEQADAISRIAGRMDDFRREADRERSRDSKVHALLGISAGIFAVIIVL